MVSYLFAQQKTCHGCLVPMNITRRASLTDGRAFQCPQSHTYTSLRSGSFFAKSRLPLQKWLLLMYLWVREYPIKDAQEEAEVAQQFAFIGGFARCVQLNSCKHHFFLEGLVLLSKLTNNFFSANDESLFWHKLRISASGLCRLIISVQLLPCSACIW